MMNENSKITESQAIEIAKRDENLPTAIHKKIMENYESVQKFGVLSYIELGRPEVKKVEVDSKSYWEVVFKSGPISWQERSPETKEILSFHDGRIADESTAKCIVSENDGSFTYTGSCNIGLD